jgi:isopenicillin N synthase-like dioxygenase
VPGLPVLGPDERWHDVGPEPGALLVNLGDLMARWTNHCWKSTLHQVKPPVVDGRIQRRRSAAFFHDGNSDALIESRPMSAAGANGYPPIRVDDHIATNYAAPAVVSSTPTPPESRTYQTAAPS